MFRKYSPHPRGCFLVAEMQQILERIFPASAGVFLLIVPIDAFNRDIPRIRGGVSRTPLFYPCVSEYSPRLRGCFQPRTVRIPWLMIFPASAGVFLGKPPVASDCSHIPRVCGGVSKAKKDLVSRLQIFPASAGAFPTRRVTVLRSSNFLRIRGGVSRSHTATHGRWTYSPHPRGCFYREPYRRWYRHIFPASAGVFPSSA